MEYGSGVLARGILLLAFESPDGGWHRSAWDGTPWHSKGYRYPLCVRIRISDGAEIKIQCLIFEI
jgi:hypothetical protein